MAVEERASLFVDLILLDDQMRNFETGLKRRRTVALDVDSSLLDEQVTKATKDRRTKVGLEVTGVERANRQLNEMTRTARKVEIGSSVSLDDKGGIQDLTAQIQAQLEDVAKQAQVTARAVELALSGISITPIIPYVNFDVLHKLNDLIDIKEAHIKKAAKTFRDNPLVASVQYQSVGSGTAAVSASGPISITESHQVELTASSDLISAIAAAVERGVRDANKVSGRSKAMSGAMGLVKGAAMAPFKLAAAPFTLLNKGLQKTATGLFEGIGRDIAGYSLGPKLAKALNDPLDSFGNYVAQTADRLGDLDTAALRFMQTLMRGGSLEQATSNAKEYGLKNVAPIIDKLQAFATLTEMPADKQTAKMQIMMEKFATELQSARQNLVDKGVIQDKQETRIDPGVVADRLKRQKEALKGITPRIQALTEKGDGKRTADENEELKGLQEQERGILAQSVTKEVKKLAMDLARAAKENPEYQGLTIESIVIEELSKPLKPLLTDVLQPIKDVIKPFLRNIATIQSFNAIDDAGKHKKHAAYQIHQPLNDEELFTMFVGGSQGYEGLGGHEAAQKFGAAYYRNSQNIGIDNPDTDIKGGEDGWVTTLIKKLVPGLADNAAFTDTFGNLAAQIEYAVDPTRSSVAVSQMTAYREAALEAGYKPENIRGTSYSLGGAEQARFSLVLDLLEDYTTRLLAMAYPTSNIVGTGPQFKSAILEPDPLSAGVRLGVFGEEPGKNFTLDDTNVAAGNEAHGPHHLTKSKTFISLIEDWMGGSIQDAAREFAPNDKYPEAALLQSQGEAYSALGALHQLKAFMTTGEYDQRTPYRGATREIGGDIPYIELLSNVFKGLSTKTSGAMGVALEKELELIGPLLKQFLLPNLSAAKRDAIDVKDLGAIPQRLKDVGFINDRVTALKAGEFDTNVGWTGSGVMGESQEDAIKKLTEYSKWINKAFGASTNKYMQDIDTTINAMRSIYKAIQEGNAAKAKQLIESLELLEANVPGLAKDINAIPAYKPDLKSTDTYGGGHIDSVVKRGDGTTESINPLDASAYNTLINAFNGYVPMLADIQGKFMTGFDGLSSVIETQGVILAAKSPEDAAKEATLLRKLQGRGAPQLIQHTKEGGLVQTRAKGVSVQSLMEESFKRQQAVLKGITPRVKALTAKGDGNRTADENEELNRLRNQEREIMAQTKGEFKKYLGIIISVQKELHKLGVAHGDLTGGNVFYDAETSQATAIDLAMGSRTRLDEGEEGEATGSELMDKLTTAQRLVIDPIISQVLNLGEIVPNVLSGGGGTPIAPWEAKESIEQEGFVEKLFPVQANTVDPYQADPDRLVSALEPAARKAYTEARKLERAQTIELQKQRKTDLAKEAQLREKAAKEALEEAEVAAKAAAEARKKASVGYKIEMATKAITGLDDGAEGLTGTIDNLDDGADRLTRTLLTLKDAAEELTDGVDDTADGFTTAIKGLDDASADLKGTLLALKDAAEELTDGIDDTGEGFTTTIKKLDTSAEELTGRMNILGTANKKLTGSVNTLDSSLKDLIATLNGARNEADGKALKGSDDDKRKKLKGSDGKALKGSDDDKRKKLKGSDDDKRKKLKGSDEDERKRLKGTDPYGRKQLKAATQDARRAAKRYDKEHGLQDIAIPIAEAIEGKIPALRGGAQVEGRLTQLRGAGVSGGLTRLNADDTRSGQALAVLQVLEAEVISLGDSFNDHVLAPIRPAIRFTIGAWREVFKLAADVKNLALDSIPGGQIGAKVGSTVAVPAVVAGALSLAHPEAYAMIHEGLELAMHLGLDVTGTFVEVATAAADLVPALKPFATVLQGLARMGGAISHIPGAGQVGSGLLEAGAAVGTGRLAIKGVKETTKALTPRVIREELDYAALKPGLRRLLTEAGVDIAPGGKKGQTTKTAADLEAEVKRQQKAIAWLTSGIMGLGRVMDATLPYIKRGLNAFSSIDTVDVVATAGDQERLSPRRYENASVEISAQINAIDAILDKFRDGATTSPEQEKALLSLTWTLVGVAEQLLAKVTDTGNEKSYAAQAGRIEGRVGEANRIMSDRGYSFDDLTIDVDGEDVGEEYGNGIAIGLGSSIKKAQKAALEEAAKIDEAARRGLDIHSPSKKGIQTGEYYGQGLALGIYMSKRHVSKALETMWALAADFELPGFDAWDSPASSGKLSLKGATSPSSQDLDTNLVDLSEAFDNAIHLLNIWSNSLPDPWSQPTTLELLPPALPDPSPDAPKLFAAKPYPEESNPWEGESAASGRDLSWKDLIAALKSRLPDPKQQRLLPYTAPLAEDPWARQSPTSDVTQAWVDLINALKARLPELKPTSDVTQAWVDLIAALKNRLPELKPQKFLPYAAPVAEDPWALPSSRASLSREALLARRSLPNLPEQRLLPPTNYSTPDPWKAPIRSSVIDPLVIDVRTTAFEQAIDELASLYSKLNDIWDQPSDNSLLERLLPDPYRVFEGITLELQPPTRYPNRHRTQGPSTLDTKPRPGKTSTADSQGPSRPGSLAVRTTTEVPPQRLLPPAGLRGLSMEELQELLNRSNKLNTPPPVTGGLMSLRPRDDSDLRNSFAGQHRFNAPSTGFGPTIPEVIGQNVHRVTSAARETITANFDASHVEAGVDAAVDALYELWGQTADLREGFKDVGAIAAHSLSQIAGGLGASEGLQQLIRDLGFVKAAGNLSFGALIVGATALSLSSLAAAMEMRQITLVAQSVGLSANEIDKINESAAESSLNFRGLAETATSLRGALQGTAQEGSALEMAAQIERIGLAMQIPEERLDRFRVAISQMAAKGVISMEELRQQAAEAVPQVIGATADALGTSRESLTTVIASGTVSSADNLPKILDNIEAGVGAGIEGNQNSLLGVMNQVDRVMFKTQATMGQFPLEIFTSLAILGKDIMLTFEPVINIVAQIVGGIGGLATMLVGATLLTAAINGAFALMPGLISAVAAASVAALTTPLGIALVALGALATAWVALDNLMNGSARRSDKLNQSLINTNDLLKEQLDLRKKNRAAEEGPGPEEFTVKGNEVTSDTEVYNAEGKKTVTLRGAANEAISPLDRVRENLAGDLDRAPRNLIEYAARHGVRQRNTELGESDGEQVKVDLKDQIKEAEKVSDLVDDLAKKRTLVTVDFDVNAETYIEKRKAIEDELNGLQTQVIHAKAGIISNEDLKENELRIKMLREELKGLADETGVGFSPEEIGGIINNLQARRETLIKNAKGESGTGFVSEQTKQAIADVDAEIEAWTQNKEILEIGISLKALDVELAAAQGAYTEALQAMEQASLEHFQSVADMRLNEQINEATMSALTAKQEEKDLAKRLIAFNQFRDARLQALRDNPEIDSVEALLRAQGASSLEDAGAEDIGKAKAIVQANPQLFASSEKIIDVLDELNQSVSEKIDLERQAAQAALATAQAERTRLASLRKVLDVMTKIDAANNALATFSTARTQTVNNDFTRAKLGVDITQSDGAIERQNIELEDIQADRLISILEEEMDYRQAFIEQYAQTSNLLDAAQRSFVKTLLNGKDLTQASLLELNLALAELDNREAGDKSVDADVRAALQAQVTGETLSLENQQKAGEILGLQQGKVDRQASQIVKLTERDIRGLQNQYNDAARGLTRSFEDLMESMTDSLRSISTELRSARTETVILEGRNRLMDAVDGLESPFISMFDTITSAITSIQDIVAGTEDRVAEASKQPLRIQRQLEDFQLEGRNTLTSVQEAFQDAVGQGSPIAFTGTKGQIDPGELFKSFAPTATDFGAKSPVQAVTSTVAGNWQQFAQGNIRPADQFQARDRYDQLREKSLNGGITKAELSEAITAASVVKGNSTNPEFDKLIAGLKDKESRIADNQSPVSGIAATAIAPISPEFEALAQQQRAREAEATRASQALLEQNNKLTESFRELNDVKVGNVLLQLEVDLKRSVFELNQSFRELPISLGRFKHSIEDAVNSGRTPTLEAEFGRRKEEISLSFQEFRNQGAALLQQINSLAGSSSESDSLRGYFTQAQSLGQKNLASEDQSAFNAVLLSASQRLAVDPTLDRDTVINEELGNQNLSSTSLQSLRTVVDQTSGLMTQFAQSVEDVIDTATIPEDVKSGLRDTVDDILKGIEVDPQRLEALRTQLDGLVGGLSASEQAAYANAEALFGLRRAQEAYNYQSNFGDTRFNLLDERDGSTGSSSFEKTSRRARGERDLLQSTRGYRQSQYLEDNKNSGRDSSQLLEDFDELEDLSLSNLNREINSVGTALEEGLGNILQDTLYSLLTLEGGFEELGRNALTSVRDMVAQIAAELIKIQIIKGIKSLFGGGLFSEGGEVQGLATGGMVMPANYATGGGILAGIAKSAQRESLLSGGKKPVLIMAHEGEEVLSTRNGDADLWRSLKQTGALEMLREGKANRAYGGTAGSQGSVNAIKSFRKQPVQQSGGNKYDYSTHVYGAKDYESFRRSSTQLSGQSRRRNSEDSRRDIHGS
jgi:tape measure domain-containing protein